MPLITTVVYDSKVIKQGNFGTDGFPAIGYSEVTFDKCDTYKYYRLFSAFNIDGYKTYKEVISSLDEIDNIFESGVLNINSVLNRIHEIIGDGRNYKAIILFNTNEKCGIIEPIPALKGLPRLIHYYRKKWLKSDYYLIYPFGRLKTKIRYHFYATLGYILCLGTYSLARKKGKLTLDDFSKYIYDTTLLVSTHAVDFIKKTAPLTVDFPIRVFGIVHGELLGKFFYYEFLMKGEINGKVTKEH